MDTYRLIRVDVQQKPTPYFKRRKRKKVEAPQSHATLCGRLDCSLPGFSVHGILQARVPEWVAISFSRGSSRPRDRTQVSHIVGICFTL